MPVSQAGRRVAVLACGHGKVAIALALASPVDTVAGFDADPTAIATARRAAAEAGVADRVTFEVADTLAGHGYDLVYLANRPIESDSGGGAMDLVARNAHPGALVRRPQGRERRSAPAGTTAATCRPIAFVRRAGVA